MPTNIESPAEPLKFGHNIFIPTVRTLNNMKSVLYDTDWLETAGNLIVYSFFRNLYLKERHRDVMKKYGIQYDITIILPNMLGMEFAKTHGHYHPKKPGTNVSYTEIYEVLSGDACYLLQKEENGSLVDVVMIKASAGDKVIIPPNYGHVTINASGKILKMANWVCSNFSADYAGIKKRRGGAYFMLANDRLVPNMNYGRVPPLRFAESTDLSIYGIEKQKRLYDLIKNPELLEFLTHPELYSFVL